MAGGTRLTRFAVSLGTAVPAVLLLGFAFGPGGAAGGAVGAVLWIAWRHDNRAGVCLPLAVMVLIVIGVMALLLYLMAVVGSSG